ncbi:peptide chain release factor N(5)-glutamine methyltransferase [Oceanivirga salmonicida]|uniref:peptide chain release factor N(5)-glutamine methyltransferase n=1 Tax=Oceanivirga salmonicida TaxID=1769291 RepID=UPI000833B8E0|nr:peptide chain release factor N(5)-glutamine methyltransferase [Oceanivirga salmonicida]
MSKLIELLNKTVVFFENKKAQNPRLEAEKLFSKALNIDRIMLYANFDRILTDEEISKIRHVMKEKDTTKENTLKEFLDSSIVYLKKYNVYEASLIAELVFSKVLKIDRMMLFISYEKKINEEEKNRIREYLKKIALENMPYQYVFNEQNFYGRDFFIDKGVLIPRHDTEVLVEKVLEISKQDSLVLDIGTGSGVIAITIAKELPKSKVLAIDISDKALEISKKNTEFLNAKNVKIVKSNLFENIEFKEFDIIVSNPPYISNKEVEEVGLNTYIHEPHEALFANSDGLYFYYEISKNAKEYLKNGGYLAFEIGYKQKKAVNDILTEFGYVDIKNYTDLNGLDRVVIARKG